MPEARNRKSDLVGLALLALACFLSLPLRTYDPADPPSANVYPPRAHVTNACGHIGARVAHLLLEGMGLAAFYFVLSLIVVAVLLLRQKPIEDRLLRGLGWCLSLVGLTTLFTLVAPGLSVGP